MKTPSQTSSPLTGQTTDARPVKPTKTPQVNIRDALLRTISFTAPNGKAYRLRPEAELATLIVR